MYTADTSGAIYQSYYSSSACSGSPSSTFKYTSTYCGSCTASGCSSTYLYTSGLPTSGSTYQINSYYTSSTCSGSPYFVSAVQASSCAASVSCISSSSSGTIISCSSGPTTSPTASPTTGVSVVSGPGSVTTGYAVLNVNYAASDTTCTGKFTSGSAYILGVCIPAGGSSTGGYKYTADTSGAIYQSYYSSSTCSGSPSSTYTFAPTFCGSCTASGCSSTWQYSSDTQTSGSTYQIYSYYSGATCSGSPYYVFANQASACVASTSCKSSGSSSYTTTCSAGSTPVGTITTGYVVTSTAYGSDSTCSTTPTYASVIPLGTCIPYSGTSSGGSMYTADGNGIIYLLTYTSTTCTAGTVTQSQALSKKSCAASSSNSYSKGYYYSATIPSVGTGTVQTYTYNVGGCPGTLWTITMFQASACTSSSCTLSNGYGVTSTCTTSGGVAATTVGTITTGYAIAQTLYASSDTTCSTPLGYNINPLGTCLPYTSSSNGVSTSGGLIGSADANGNIYAAYYSSSTTCAGTPSSSVVVPKSGCICSSAGCYRAFSYSATVPTLSGAYQTNTVYSGSSCSGTRIQIALQLTPSCTAATCVSSGPTQSSSITCSGTTITTTPSNFITAGYAVINATYAATGEPPSSA